MPQVTGLGQSTRVSSCSLQVVGHKAPIKVGRLAQPLQHVVRARGKATTPEGTLSRLACHDYRYFPWFRFAEILLGSDHSSMKPFAWDWSNVSPVS